MSLECNQRGKTVTDVILTGVPILLAVLMIFVTVRDMHLSDDRLHLLAWEILLAALPVLIVHRF